jgi:hypothetical protein
MITHNESMPIKDLEGNSLSNTNHRWKHGEGWFEYIRNSDGYRSEEFQKNTNFLFAGCSETFGESAEYKTTWAYKLFNKIKKDKDSYCNVSMPGIDVSIIIFNIMLFIEKYGKPKNIFIVFPGFNRIIESESKSFTACTVYPDEELHEESHEQLSPASKRVVDMIRSVNALQIKNFEMFCREENISLFWSTWDSKSNNHILKLDTYKNYVGIISDKDIAEHAIDLGYKIKTLELTRSDGVHHGEIFHDYWSNVFYNKYKENIK